MKKIQHINLTFLKKNLCCIFFLNMRCSNSLNNIFLFSSFSAFFFNFLSNYSSREKIRNNALKKDILSIYKTN